MKTGKAGLAAVALAILALYPAQSIRAETMVIQPSLGQPGYGNNSAAQPYMPPLSAQQQSAAQGLYNNSYNAMQNNGLAQPNPQNPWQQAPATQIKYIYKGGFNEARPLMPEEMPQRIFHNCPCRNYESTY